MFYALPASTVYEAKERNRRATFFLFLSLILIYVLFFNLLAAPIDWFLNGLRVNLPSAWAVAGIGTGFAVVLAAGHFWIARGRTLDSLLDQIGAKDADPSDQLHAQFIHVVSEMESAAGFHGVRPVVLATPGLNAFSMEDGKNRRAIGITEGLLAKLNRAELSAVVAHEAAHLLHEDSRLVTTACFLFGIFGTLRAFLGQAVSGSNRTSYPSVGLGRSKNGGMMVIVVVVLWLISALGYVITKLVFMAISREREYLADADGVQMCKDPIALAQSLYKISNRYRGGLPETFAALFIMNPDESNWDDGEGWMADLFSTHPPVHKRLKKLLDWAKSDLAALQSIDAQEEKGLDPPSRPSDGAASAAFMAYQNGEWAGPYTPDQMTALGLLVPECWVCPVGSQAVTQVSQNPVLLPLLLASAASASGLACPRCKVPLLSVQYEGAEILKCGFCKGTLLKAGVLERLIGRDRDDFTADEIEKARVWRNSQRGSIADRDHFPPILCPLCHTPMGKFVHSLLTQVIIDRCFNEACGSIWCDGGELETIQILIEDAHSSAH
jgi:heat shock protein HtpX